MARGSEHRAGRMLPCYSCSDSHPSLKTSIYTSAPSSWVLLRATQEQRSGGVAAPQAHARTGTEGEASGLPKILRNSTIHDGVHLGAQNHGACRLRHHIMRSGTAARTIWRTRSRCPALPTGRRGRRSGPARTVPALLDRDSWIVEAYLQTVRNSEGDQDVSAVPPDLA